MPLWLQFVLTYGAGFMTPVIIIGVLTYLASGGS